MNVTLTVTIRVFYSTFKNQQRKAIPRDPEYLAVPSELWKKEWLE